jgi:uncharacterized membrane protein YcaP (DUF421 family)
MVFVEIFLQTLLAFAALLIFARLLGKQQVGQLTFFEYITGITIGSIGGTMATDIAPNTTLRHFTALALFCAFTGLVQYISMVSRPARKLLDGEPAIVMHNGKILEKNMKAMRYNLDELLQQLRGKNVFDLGQVEFAILEPDGELSVQLKSQHRPATPSDLQISTNYEGVGSELIMDGKIVHQNLVQNNLDEDWLRQQLAAHGVMDIRQVGLASLATDGKLYFDLKDDKLPHTTDISDTFSQGRKKH